MTDESSPARRRRRRRATAAQGAPAHREPATSDPQGAPGAPPQRGTVPVPHSEAAEPARGEQASGPSKRARPNRDPAERGLRDLIGAGKSQLGVSGALRGRDVNRPTDEDLAEAEQTVVIVRRHWQPTPEREQK